MSGYSPILELGDDPHPLTPREKVVFKQPCEHCQRMTTVDLTALASGSGDHAELEEEGGDCDTCDGAGEVEARIGFGTDYVPCPECVSRENRVEKKVLLAEIAALRGERDRNWEEYLAERQARMDHGSREAGYLDQIDKLNSRATEAERKLAEAVGLLREAVEPYEHISNVRAFEVMENGPATRLVAIRTFLSKEAERG